MKKQTGFTMIELMITIALGLVVVAAALMMLFSGQKNVALQKSSASLQDDQNFGLAYIAKNVRQANLFTPSAEVKAGTRYAGIVFNAENLDSNLMLVSDFKTKYVTQASNASNMKVKGTTSATNNDQLVVQYRPAEAGYDCEGKVIGPTTYVVERYFVRTDTNGGRSADERAALACASSHYSGSLTAAQDLETGTNGIYGSGQILMQRVDLFKVRFLTQSGAGTASSPYTYRYMTAAEYKTAADAAVTTTPVGNTPRILAIQLGVIARAVDPTTESSVTTTQEFNLFGQTFVQKEGFPSRYIRTPIVQTIALRNALGDRS
ncbi:PilW family protein [Acinetobacter sp. AND/436]|uniref:PilW family protein n=1 Tax=Acinetobacter sp. AND/436 TaxID=3414736 RepID=UPI003C2F2555